MSNRFDSVSSTDAQYSPTDRGGSCIQHAYSEVFDCQLKQQRSRSGDQSESLTNLEFTNIFPGTSEGREASQGHHSHGHHSHHHRESPANNQPTDSTSSNSSATSTGDSTSSNSSVAAAGDSAITPSNSTIDTPPAGSDKTHTANSTATMVGLDKMPVGLCAANYSDLDGNGSKITPDLLNSLKSQGYGGLDQVYDLPRDRALTQSELNNLNQDLETAKAAGMPLVLRFRYADDAGQPDAPANVILSQMKQLSPVLSANEGAIGIMEMGFVGAWGEWNRSTNNPLNDKDFALQKQMYDIYSQSLPDTPIAFSHADTLREMFGENSIPNNVMLFDDSIGKQNGSDSTQNDSGEFYQPGDYEWAMQHRVMFTGENQEVGTPQLVLQRIHDLNLTSIKLWGPVEDAINQGGYRDQIAQALKQNAEADGIAV